MMVKKPASLLAVATRSGRGRYYGLPGETMALPGAPPGREPEPGLDGRIVRIAVPSLFALALDPILNVVDTAFVGLGGGGAAPLAAVSASTSFFGFVFACTNCFASAGTPLVAAELKPGGGGEAGALALGSSIVRSALLVGVVLALAAEAVSGPAMDLFAPAYELHGAAVDFSRLRALSAPAVVAAAALNGSLRGLGDASSALKAASLAAVVNVLLDIALIYGLGMNPNGAAIATACAEYAAAAYLGAVFLSRRRVLGGDVAAAEAALDRRWRIFLAATTAYIGTASADPAAELAAHLVLKQFYLVLSFATDALAVAAQQLVASAPDAAAARAVARRLLAWGLVVGVVFAAALHAAALTSDAAVAAAAEDELRRVVAPLQVLSSLVFVGDGVLQGSRDFTFGAYAVSAAALVAAATLFAPVDGRDALSAAWDAIAVLNGCRFFAFAYRFYARGPLVARAEDGDAEAKV
ncbi:hypothetical protein JL721_11564 [Aureococcus anophagefferens]|nr:hypothetical protein JL721_11564 [Aureococcus anophagefferens]